MRHERFAEVGNHVPRAVVDQADDFAAFVGVLADRDVEIGDVAVERRADVAVIDVEFRVVDRRLGGFAARIDIAELAELVLRLAAPRSARASTAASAALTRDRALKTSLAVTKCFGSSGSMRFEILLVVGGVGFEPASIRLRESNRVLERLDIELGQLSLAVAASSTD